MVGRDSYVPHRRLLYALLWIISVAELGLTAFRIHFTRKTFGTHDAIVAELLFVSILTLIWVPLTLLFHRSALASRGGNTRGGNARGGGGLEFLHGETSGNFILWILWLVGAAIATHTWPTRALAGPGKQGLVLITIVALAWVVFGLLTLAKIFSAMEYAAINAIGDGAGYGTGGGYSGARDKSAMGGVNGTTAGGFNGTTTGGINGTTAGGVNNTTAGPGTV